MNMIVRVSRLVKPYSSREVIYDLIVQYVWLLAATKLMQNLSDTDFTWAVKAYRYIAWIFFIFYLKWVKSYLI